MICVGLMRSVYDVSFLVKFIIIAEGWAFFFDSLKCYKEISLTQLVAKE